MKSRNASSIVFLLIKCNNVSDRIGLIAADKMVNSQSVFSKSGRLKKQAGSSRIKGRHFLDFEIFRT